MELKAFAAVRDCRLESSLFSSHGSGLMHSKLCFKMVLAISEGNMVCDGSCTEMCALRVPRPPHGTLLPNRTTELQLLPSEPGYSLCCRMVSSHIQYSHSSSLKFSSPNPCTETHAAPSLMEVSQVAHEGLLRLWTSRAHTAVTAARKEARGDEGLSDCLIPLAGSFTCANSRFKASSQAGAMSRHEPPSLSLSRNSE